MENRVGLSPTAPLPLDFQKDTLSLTNSALAPAATAKTPPEEGLSLSVQVCVCVLMAVALSKTNLTFWSD